MSLLTISVSPDVAFAALIAGVLAIYVELARPGLVLPGAAGAVLALLALSALPLNAPGATLLLAAGALFFLEARFPARGFFAVAAAAAVILGAAAMRVHLAVALALGAPFSFVTMRLIRVAAQARRNKR